MTTDVVGLYNKIMNITNELVGRKVVRASDENDSPAVGKIVAVGLNMGGRLWVVWPSTNGEPTPHHARELLALKENELSKTLRWHGKTLVGLETFLKQVRHEGAAGDTELNPGKEEHVHIRVELPLATPPSDPPKHNHEFDVDCVDGKCPAFGYDWSLVNQRKAEQA